MIRMNWKKNGWKLGMLAAIWVTVCGLAWHMINNVLPAYGYGHKKTTGRGGFNMQDWQKMQADSEAFFKEEVPKKIEMKIKRVDQNQRMGGMTNSRYLNNGYFMDMHGVGIKQMVNNTKGVQPWKITMEPEDQGRWDVRVKAPMSEQQKIGDELLAYFRWQMKTKRQSVPGLKFMEPGGEAGGVPAKPDFKGNANQVNNYPRVDLRTVVQFASWRFNCPVEVDEAVAKKMPLADDKQFKMPYNFSKDEMASYIAASYGVAVKKENVDTDMYLVYNPKYASKMKMDKWEAGPAPSE